MRPQVRGVCPKCTTPNPYTSMFCSLCGARLPWAAAVQSSPSDQVSTDEQSSTPERALSSAHESTSIAHDKPSFGYALQGFTFPVIGLILYFALRADTPLRARSAGRGALWGFFVQLVIVVVLLISIRI
jgi:hypothetical protein